jgi:YtkA-like
MVDLSRWALVLFAAAPLAIAGCGSGAATTDSSSIAFSTCATEKRAVPYQPGMEVTSSAGLFKVKLVESVPGPPVKGNEVWTIEVDDATSTSTSPLDGLTVSVTPWMPDHGHGTEPVNVTASGGGKYGLDPLYLYMRGYWEIRLAIAAGAGATATADDAMIPICIP